MEIHSKIIMTAKKIPREKLRKFISKIDSKWNVKSECKMNQVRS